MRLLRVITSLDPAQGGVAAAVESTSKLLKPLVSSVHLLCVDSKEAPWLRGRSEEVFGVGPAKTGWAYCPALRSWLEDVIGNYDAVLIEGLWQYPGMTAARLCRKRGIPYFVFPHGMLDPWFQQWSHRGVKVLRNLILWGLFDRLTVSGARGMLFTCEEERRLARLPFPQYRPREEKVVGLGTEMPPLRKAVESSVFFETCPELKGNHFFLFLSRIHSKKGVDLLLEAYSQYLGSLPEGKEAASLVIAGPGIESEYGKMVLKESLRIGCFVRSGENTFNTDRSVKNGAGVYFPGMLEGAAKWGAFHHCEAFVLPSHQENFGLVVAEALSCEKPVLISKQVNIWNEVQEFGAGIVFEDSMEGTLSALNEWSRVSEGERLRMAVSAKRCFDECFDLTVTTERLFNYLRGSLVE